ncbi:GH12 family glycosyl hydrolase domain-containing protein [Asticcacaulis sp.]|uniref:GH12 family glycosyl hydrolase domain-containing protein n=1 Tax=Asticcacaulis sp. TaxID=1872648 RepID=UPI003F7B81B0
MFLTTMQALVLFGGCSGPARASWTKSATETVSCADYHSEISGRDIYNNNVWNKGAAGDFKWSQCIERDPKTGALGWSWSWPENGKDIFGYPQVKQGASPWAPLPNIPSALPIRNDAVRSLRVSHDLEIQTNGRHNVATSMWLTRSGDISENPNPSDILAELMIWTYATSGHLTPAGSKTTEVELDGQVWEVWVDKNWGDASGENSNRWIYLTFRSKNPSLHASYDVAKLTEYAVGKGILPKQFYYADVELGTEIMSGSGLAWVKDFKVEIEPVRRQITN